MREHHRAFFVCEGDPEITLTVDLVIDENRRWVEHFITAGWWGRPNSDDVWPFILQKGGRMDFGNDVDNPLPSNDRYAWIDISEQIVAQKEKYTVRYKETADYVLERLTRFSDLIEI